jgi:hypothetical protein
VVRLSRYGGDLASHGCGSVLFAFCVRGRGLIANAGVVRCVVIAGSRLQGFALRSSLRSLRFDRGISIARRYELRGRAGEGSLSTVFPRRWLRCIDQNLRAGDFASNRCTSWNSAEAWRSVSPRAAAHRYAKTLRRSARCGLVRWVARVGLGGPPGALAASTTLPPSQRQGGAASVERKFSRLSWVSAVWRAAPNFTHLHWSGSKIAASRWATGEDRPRRSRASRAALIE